MTTLAQTHVQPASAPLAADRSVNPISFRAVVLGLFLVLFVATFVPYSDYIRKNTYLIGNHLPLIVISVITAMCVLINPLLESAFLRWRGVRIAGLALSAVAAYLFVGAAALLWAAHTAQGAPLKGVLPALSTIFTPSAVLCGLAPGAAVSAGEPAAALIVAALSLAAFLGISLLLTARRFSTGEMIVAIGMLLVACALPTSGFFRYFHSMLAGIIYYAPDVTGMQKYVKELPAWLFPGGSKSDPAVNDFYKGIDPRSGGSIWATWSAWATPYAAWSCFLAAFFGAIFFFCALMRKQWVRHERLAFPLAAIPLELMAEPESGSRWSPLWKNRILWIGIAIPFFIHIVNGLALFHPTAIPKIPIEYNLESTFSEFPWNGLSWAVKRNTVFFSVVGVTFFVSLQIAFSMWFFYLTYEVAKIFIRQSGVDVTGEHAAFQGIGMYLAYGVLLFWIARHHLLHVAKNLFKPREPEEFLPYGISAGGLLVCILAATVFLTVAGMSWWLALLAFVLLIYWCIILSRVVMEAGVLLVQVPLEAEPLRFLGLLVTKTTQTAVGTAEAFKNWALSAMSLRMTFTDQRETLMPFAANAMRMGSELRPRSRLPFFGLLVAALVICLVASGATHHIISYTWGRGSDPKFDGYSYREYPQNTIKQASVWAEEGKAPSLNRGAHIAYGATAMGVVGVTRFFFTNSPLHPIGLLLLNSYALHRIWFSVLLAWAAKFLILRFGGAKAYNHARPFFMGLLIGESLGGLTWAITGLFLNFPSGAGYQILPG